MTVEKLRDGLADGRILSGKQAKEAGFVDETGYFEDAIDARKTWQGQESARRRYLRPFSLRDVLRIFGKNDQTKVRIEVTTPSLKLEAASCISCRSALPVSARTIGAGVLDDWVFTIE